MVISAVTRKGRRRVAFQFKYAYPGPPFNFLGTFTLSQKNAFESWVNARLPNSSAIETFHRIRAQQFRKTAGVLEKYYASLPTPLAPTFSKPAWQPGPQGHWINGPRNDHMPMVYVSDIKAYMQPQFEYDDDAVFFMNHLRTVIERNEDEAEYASLANAAIEADFAQIDSLFTQPQYQAVLVDDVNPSNMYTGANGNLPPQPYFRVNALDAPTTWELEQHSKSTDGTIQVKFPNSEVGQ
jgi:hypothetical protein